MPNETPLFQSGALPDVRVNAEKIKDYKLEELVASVNPVVWTEKPPMTWRHFPIFNQNGSGSCVAQTMAKLLGVMYWLKNQHYVHFSATHIYQQRANKPEGGMAGIDAFDIARKGITLEELVPSQIMTDKQMDGTLIEQYKKDVGTVFKIPNYLSIATNDIETIASVIQTTGKAVMVWFYFQADEWTDVPKIKNTSLNLSAGVTLRHSVTAVDFTLYNGKKALIIEDSWGDFGAWNGQRVITEDFFKARNWFAAYPISFVFNQDSVRPKFTFLKVLKFGMKNLDVEALQKVLIYEGMFPANSPTVTGYFGAITAKAVMAFQRKYSVAPEEEIVFLAGRNVGPKTLSKLNELYGV